MKAVVVIMLIGVGGGFLMGFIGVGASFLLVIVLVKLKVNMNSLMATLPVMIAFSCLMGTVIQIMTGFL